MSKLNRLVFDFLAQSQFVHGFAESFRTATGLHLIVVNADEIGTRTSPAGDVAGFCRYVQRSDAGCAGCRQTQLQLLRSVRQTHQSQSIRCQSGLVEVAVPVVIGRRCPAVFVAGQVICEEATREQFEGICRWLSRWDAALDRRGLETAFFQTPVVRKQQLEASVQLLTMFAQQMAESANRWIIEVHNQEPSRVARAKEFVKAHIDESIRMRQVAGWVHLSAGYFCESFRKATGMTFTEYVLRTRVEKAKDLLANPSTRVSEAAYEAGFQSIPYFNRVFKKHVGMSPSQYRSLPQGR